MLSKRPKNRSSAKIESIIIEYMGKKVKAKKQTISTEILMNIENA
jgi:hypothetical protein